MTMRRQVWMLGAVLAVSIYTGSVCSAQEQGAGAVASETAPAKHNDSSGTNSAPDANAIGKASEGTRMGLVGRFVDDQRQIWTSPAKLRFSDTEWLVPLSGITAGLFGKTPAFRKHRSPKHSTLLHPKQHFTTRIS